MASVLLLYTQYIFKSIYESFNVSEHTPNMLRISVTSIEFGHSCSMLTLAKRWNYEKNNNYENL